MKKTPTIFHPSVWWPQVLMDCNLVQCRTFPCASLFGLKLVILDRQFEVYKYYSKHCALGNKGVNNQLYHNMILYRFVGMTIWSRYHSVTIRFRFSSQACDRYDAISYAHLTQSFTHPHLDNGGQERRRQMCVAVTEKKKKMELSGRLPQWAKISLSVLFRPGNNEAIPAAHTVGDVHGNGDTHVPCEFQNKGIS